VPRFVTQDLDFERLLWNDFMNRAINLRISCLFGNVLIGLIECEEVLLLMAIPNMKERCCLS